MKQEKELLESAKKVKELFEDMLAVSCEQMRILGNAGVVEDIGELALRSVNRRQEIIEKIDSEMQVLGRREEGLGLSGLSPEAVGAGCLEGLYSEYIREYVQIREEISRIIVSIRLKSEESSRLMESILDDTAQKLRNVRINKRAVRAYLWGINCCDPWFIDKKK